MRRTSPFRLWWILAILLLACSCAWPGHRPSPAPAVPEPELAVPAGAIALPPWLALPVLPHGAKPTPIEELGLPPFHRAVQLWQPPYGGPRVTGDGMVLRLSAGVGLEPLRLGLWWHITLRPQDRETSLVAIDEESELVAHRSDVSLSHAYPTETRTSHWELPTGRYEIVGCVLPGKRCVRAGVVVQGAPVV